MQNFSKVEDTLFVPMLGRIYASEHYPQILNDKKALSLKPLLPKNLKGQDTQTQYTLMASAVRSVNMDRYIQKFLSENPNGVIAQLGCGLETTFYRNDNGKNEWFEIDLPEVIEYRKEILPETDRNHFIVADAFGVEWIKQIRQKFATEPILVTASGLFYYFEKEKVFNLITQLKEFGNIEMVFDAVNSAGIKQMNKYMKQVGHEDALMYFYVDDAYDIAQNLGVKVLKEEPYYAHIAKKGFKFMTNISMKVSDKFNMVKMIHLKINK